MNRFNIEGYDILLENYKPGQGTIIIAGPQGNYSHYWAAMGKGTSIEKFLLEINEDYFYTKLSPSQDRRDFNAKKTLTEIRRYIKDESELEWYDYMEAQKELREELRGMRFIDNADSFLNRCINIHNELIYPCLDRQDERDFKGIVQDIFMEPWHFLQYDKSDDEVILRKLFKGIQKHLFKNCKTCS